METNWGAPGYRIKGKTINDILEYKSLAKAFAYTHLCIFIGALGLYYLHCIPVSSLILNLILNPYCIITQRYTCIRINEILEKQEELEKRKTENKTNNGKEKNLDNALTHQNQFEKEKQSEPPMDTYYRHHIKQKCAQNIPYILNISEIHLKHSKDKAYAHN